MNTASSMGLEVIAFIASTESQAVRCRKKRSWASRGKHSEHTAHDKRDPV